DVLHVSAREKGLDLRTDYRGDAGEAFAGDETRIQQIVSNLVSNAVKFTDAGRVIVDVHAKIDETDSDRARIIISVEDTGIGLTDEEQSQIFERFEQADGSMSRKRGGVGLGLWICKSLCDAMGGAISVTSKHGVGSVFTVELRLAYAASNRTICPGYGTRAENHASEYRTKILLAEDHLVNQRVFAIILEAAGFDLTIADNGVEAVELAIEDQYDMILMDLQMPKKDGLTAIAEIRAAEERSGRYTPIAALSANAMQEHVDAAFAAGADGHIAKPVTPEGLIAALRALPPKAGDTYQKIATG
ncbi:MAG: ATP-binding protein, partial [Pseudomonadota bacterium]